MQQTFLNNTSVNTDNFKNELSLIAGYPEGSSILVTYYSLNAPLKDIRTDLIDILTPAKDRVHVDLTEIRNFELRLSGDFNFSYEEDQNLTTLAGEAIVFAGFVPKIGDLFLYQLRNGKIGVFYVGAARRLAIGQDTYHQITFSLQQFIDADTRDRLHSCVSQEFYFDKTKYLAGNHALLTSKGYSEQKTLQQVRLEIIQNYTDRFYNSEFSSFIRPDNLYDPYVVEYWNKKVAYLDSPVRPIQILPSVQNFKKTIWAALTNYPIKDVRNFAYTWEKAIHRATFWSVNITSLLEDHYIAVGDEKATDVYPVPYEGRYADIYDPMPFIHTTRWDASIKAKAEALADSWMRKVVFFHHMHPGEIYLNGDIYRVERPSIANTSLAKLTKRPFPVDEALCRKCIHKDCCPTRARLLELAPPTKKPPKPKPFRPPFPITSTAELVMIWKQINGVPADQMTTPEQWPEIKKYTEWYYTTYQGTKTKYEIEHGWRLAQKIPEQQLLTEEQLTILQNRVHWYRSGYARVANDKELELMWRTYNNVGLVKELNEFEQSKLDKFIAAYRYLHGKVPNDDVKDKSDATPSGYLFKSKNDIPPIYFQDAKCIPTPPVDHEPPPPYDQNHNLPPLYRSGPPYPILSNEELANIWRKLHGLEEDCPLDDNQIAQAKGYILWYRETYPGTLSFSELEEEWRETNKVNCPTLTPDQMVSLENHVKAYRSKFLPVLMDREIEIIWRTRLGINLDQELTAKQLELVKMAIAHYRSKHGKVPVDRQVEDPVEVGQPFTEEELATLTPTVPPSLEGDDTEGSEGDLPSEDDDKDLPNHLLPPLYYPPIKGFHLCPNFCHMICNVPPQATTKNTEDGGDTYALSKEFYFGSNAMDPFERLLYDTLTNKEIRPDLIVDAVVRYLEWDDEDAFYRHLFSLYLIDRALYWLRFHS